MTRARIVALGALGLISILVLTAMSGGGSDPYRLRMVMANAGGLRNGSAVVIAGVRAGKVDLSLNSHRDVVVELDLEHRYGPVGRDVHATIAAVNLLGIKTVVVDPGDRTNPAPNGMTLPASHVKEATDLDQVLAALDDDTRTRLAILINEAGAGFAGRKQDFNTLLRELPPSIADADSLLSKLVHDNHTLASLVANSDGFVNSLTARRRALTGLVDTAGRTGTVLAAHRTDLRATLAKAPGTLVELQHFLGKLRATTVPLGPAARDISASAAPLQATLAQAMPFWKAASPTLAEARKAAPDIVKLADRATPVLRRAKPVAAQLAQTAAAMKPVSDALFQSSDNILAVVDNWSKAVQLRDGLSHVFRGEASYSPEAIKSMVRVLLARNASAQAKHRHKGADHTRLPQLTHDVPKKVVPQAKKLTDRLTKPLANTLDRLVPGLGDVLGGGQGDTNRDSQSLLDFLLGA